MSIKLNLGSGPDNIENWENLDWGWLPFFGKFRINKFLCGAGLLDENYNSFWENVKLVDIRKRLPYSNFSVDYIYCSHVLEHFSPRETYEILKDCKRVLKKKGILRVVLPDLDKIIKNYKNPDDFNNEFFGYEKKLYESFFGRIKEKFIRPHVWMYNVESFKKVLGNCGFGNIKICSYRKGKCKDINSLDKPIYRDLSFYIEAE